MTRFLWQWLDLSINSSKQHHDSKKTISTVKASEKPTNKYRPFHTALDWQLEVYREKQFPELTVKTLVRPYLIITSEVSKHLITMELTVPWKEYFKQYLEKKTHKVPRPAGKV